MHIDRITIKPDVCGGEPTIRGMRITVSHVLEMLAGRDDAGTSPARLPLP
jgi:uncharacterized protein (DUF433 family)